MSEGLSTAMPSLHTLQLIMWQGVHAWHNSGSINMQKFPVSIQVRERGAASHVNPQIQQAGDDDNHQNITILSENHVLKCRYYSKNPCPYGNHTFPNEVHHQGLGSTRLQGECFLGSDDAPSWKMWDFCTGMASCFYPMTCKKHQGSHAEIAHFHTRLCCMNCVLVMG